MNTSRFTDKQIMDLSNSSKGNGSDFLDLMNHPQGDHAGKEEILPSYDFQPIRPLGSSQPSSNDSTGPAATRVWTASPESKPNSGIRNYSSLDSIETAKVISEKERSVYDAAALASEIDRTMKKHADNLMHALEGVSARLSQLESRTRHLENSVDDLKVSVANNHGSTDGKMRQIANILREVQEGVHFVTDKQEILEGQLQLWKLQVPKADQQSETHTDSAQQAVASTPLQSNQPSSLPTQAPNLSLPPPNAPPQNTNQFPPHQIPPPPLPPPPPPPRDSYFPSPDPQNQQYQMPPPPPPAPQQLQPPPPQQAPPPPPQFQPPPPPQYQPPLPPHPQALQQPQYPSQPAHSPYSQPPPQHHSSQPSLPHAEENSYLSQTYPPSIRQPGGSAPPPSQQFYGGPAPPIYEPPSSRPGWYGQNESYPHSGSPMKTQLGNVYPQLPTARILPQALPTASAVGGGDGGGGGGNRVPIDDVVDKVTNMGFPRDQVRATVRKLTENGQSVDLNVVLDKLMNDGVEGQPPRGWFNR